MNTASALRRLGGATSEASEAAPDAAARYRDLFAIREFRALWLARTLSLLGDQLARVALAVLVFRQTGSPFLTALVYGLTLLPYLGGLVLAGLSDKRPRRSVMVVGDVICALAVTAMAVPGQPIAALCVLLVAATLVNPVYDAARAALMPDVLPGDIYVLGSGMNNITLAATQVLGFGAGGLLVGLVGPRPALALDALTYLVSALIVRRGVLARPAGSTRAESPLAQLSAGARLVFRTPALRALVWLAWLNGLWVVPEGLAAPYADSLHRGATVTGLFLAAPALGAIAGALVMTRMFGPARRMRLLTPFALLAAGPLVVMALHPGLVLSLLLWALSGVGTAYNLPANAAFVRALPGERRGQAFALAATGIITGQGLAIIIAGVAAQAIGPAWVIAAAGAIGVLAVLGLAMGAPYTTVESGATVLSDESLISLPQPNG
jgi:MFS family permease